MSGDRCYVCGQFVGPEGQWGFIAPDDGHGDPDFDRERLICSEKCALTGIVRTGWDHWAAVR